MKQKAVDSVKNSFSQKIRGHLMNSDKEKYLLKTANGNYVPRSGLVNIDTAKIEKYFQGKVPENIELVAKTFPMIIRNFDSGRPIAGLGNPARPILEANSVRFPTAALGRPPSPRGSCFWESTYYCSTAGGDPCTLAETLYEPYARTGNCEYNGVYAPCDRYIVPGWYKSDDLVLDQCPSLNSCGAVYPIWMNGTFPQVADGVVSRTLCKTGFGGCCVRQYDLQIKNCGTSYVYCLPALDSCPERLCFDLKTRYVVAIVAVILLVISLSGFATLMSFCYIKKRRKDREISQSRVELATDETGVESNGSPPYLDETGVESNGSPPHLHFQPK
uniref:Pancreatic secretory granule membrane major glycoprotein GP2 n=1 Tax=Magallana gigas TaxID=29159 RepID=K1QS30_MAGGI